MPCVLKDLIRSRVSRDERGSVAPESVLSLPVYLIFFALIADVSLLLLAQAKATRIAQDANRHASTSNFITETDPEDMSAASMATISPNPTMVSMPATFDLKVKAQRVLEYQS